MLKIQIIVFLFLHFLQHLSAHKILVWIPTASISHQVISHSIVKELSLRGHNVTFITTDGLKDKSLTNLTEIDVSFSYEIFRTIKWTTDDFGIGQYKMIVNFFPIQDKIIDMQLNDNKVKNALFNEKYDLLILESCLNLHLLLLRQYFKCPIVSIASFSPDVIGYGTIGDTVNPSYEGNYQLHFRRPKTFFDRIFNTYYTLWQWYYWTYHNIPKQKLIIKKHFGDKISDYNAPLYNDLILANVHPILTGVRSNFPAVINIGGVNKGVFRGLPKELKTFLDKSKNGVIYFSLGSNVKSNLLPLERRQIFIETFKKLKNINILWKFEDENLPDKPNNVFISKWIPQIDVLHHPNVKLFITQGGLQSLEETIHARVPIIGIPYMGDQLGNIDHMASHLKIGIALDRSTFTVDELYNAIQKVLKEKSFKDQINHISNIFEDNPMTPVDKAVYWIEYAIRHNGTKFLKSPKFNMTIIEYFNVDVVLFTLSMLVIILFILILIITKVIRKINKNFKPKNQKEKRN